MPEYKNSILSVITSIAKYYNIESKHESNLLLDNILKKDYTNIVLMIFDGLGDFSLKYHLDRGSFLRRNQKDIISSVFPSTTTAGTITMETALSPIEHGWLGWSLYFEELDENINIYPNTISGGDGKPAAKYHVASKYVENKSIFEKISEKTKGQVKTYTVSPFSDYKTKSSLEIFETVKKITQEKGKKYIYTYWYQPDSLMHDNGTKSAVVRNNLKDIDKQVEEFVENLEDTLVIITADHGLIDTKWKFIDQYPKIKDCLIRKPSIESRALTFFVKPEKKLEFENLFNKQLGKYYLLLSKGEVLDSKLFGNGNLHSRSNGFIGDYLAIAITDVSIECNLAVNHAIFKAAHAGLTKQEMEVPLIIIEKEKRGD